MESSQLAEKRPWELPWWKPSDGNRKTFTYIVSIHVLALVGIFLFPIPGWGLFLLVLAVISCGGLGTSLCYHRALAHRSVKLHPVVEQSLIFYAVINGSGTPSTWAPNQLRPALAESGGRLMYLGTSLKYFRLLDLLQTSELDNKCCLSAPVKGSG